MNDARTDRARDLYLKRKFLRKENAKFGPCMQRVQQDQWAHIAGFQSGWSPTEIWRSNRFLAQITARTPTTSIAILRTELKSDGNWEDGITWDELMAVKRQIGFGDRDALEVYPRDSDVVFVANIRWLWIPEHPPEFIWRSARRCIQPPHDNTFHVEHDPRG